MKKLVFCFLITTAFRVVGQPKSEFDKMSFLIGQWEFDAKSMLPDGTFQPQKFTSKVELIFGGTAHQDDFQFKDQNGNWVTYGSTIRSYDTQAGQWKMLWYNYNLSLVTQMVGEYKNSEFNFTGKGTDEKGNYIERIKFYDILENSYSWKSDKSYDNGKTWLNNFFSYSAKRL